MSPSANVVTPLIETVGIGKSYGQHRVLQNVTFRLHPGEAVAVIGEKGQPLKGYLLMVIDGIWFSLDNQLLELSLYIHPDHRKSTYAKQLMAFSKQASDGLQLNLTIGVFSTVRTDAKVRLYKRQFTPVGAFFKYTPTSAGESVQGN